MSKLKVFAPKSLTAFTMLRVEISHKFKKNADLLTNINKIKKNLRKFQRIFDQTLLTN
jgi:hypothetical protein